MTVIAKLAWSCRNAVQVQIYVEFDHKKESDGPSGNRKHGQMKTWSEEMWKHYSSDQNSRLYQKLLQKQRLKWRLKLNKRENG